MRWNVESYPVPFARVFSMTLFFLLFNRGFSPHLAWFDFGFLNVIGFIGLKICKCDWNLPCEGVPLLKISINHRQRATDHHREKQPNIWTTKEYTRKEHINTWNRSTWLTSPQNVEISVDTSEILRENQLRLVVYPCLSHYLQGFKHHPNGGWPWDFFQPSTATFESHWEPEVGEKFCTVLQGCWGPTFLFLFGLGVGLAVGWLRYVWLSFVNLLCFFWVIFRFIERLEQKHATIPSVFATPAVCATQDRTCHHPQGFSLDRTSWYKLQYFCSTTFNKHLYHFTCFGHCITLSPESL